MKKLLFLSAFIFVSMLSLASAIFSQTYFLDDFDRPDSATVGFNWTEFGTDGSTVYIKDNALVLDDVSSMGLAAVNNSKSISPYSLNITGINVMANLSTTNIFGDIILKNSTDFTSVGDTTGDFINLRFNTDGILYAQFGTAQQTEIRSFNTNEVYDINIVNINYTSETFDVWINGIENATAIGFNTSAADGIMNVLMKTRTTNTGKFTIDYFEAGSGFVSENPILITLNFPEDATTLTNLGAIAFNASLNSSLVGDGNYNLTNATFFIFNSTGIYNQTEILYANDSQYNDTVSDIVIGDYGNFQWNVFGCATNTSDYSCNFADNNFSFSIEQFSVDTVTYNQSVFETSNQDFILNISTVENVLSVEAHLIYNGTEYLSTTACASGICNITNNLDVPLVFSGEETNYSFFWNITVFDGDSFLSSQTDTYIQNVSRIYLEDCGGLHNVSILNFTAWDEQNISRVNPFLFGATFNYWLGHGDTYRNATFDNPSIEEKNICIFPGGETFRSNADIAYDSAVVNTTYNQRNYYFQNASLTNATQHIALFLLNSSFSTSFIQRVVTTSQIPVEGALIFTQRYYPENNSYETVGVTFTDNNGESVQFYQTEIPDYRHIIVKNGQVLKVTEKGKIFPQSAPFTLTFTISDGVTNPWESFEGVPNVVSNLSFDKDLQIVSYTWIDTTGTLSVANLTVESVQGNQSNEIICQQSSQLQAGTLTCNLTGFSGSFVAKGYIGRSPEIIDKIINFSINLLKDALAQPFLFLWILLLIAGISVGIMTPEAGIPLTIVIIILGGILGIAGVTWLFIWAIIAVGVWVLIEGAR